MRLRTPLLALALAVIGSAAPLLSGCSLGYTNLHPGENSAFYAPLFADIINTYDEPYWLWVRGTIRGDLDGNGRVEEELVIATIQKGTPRQPGPIEMAFLVACEVAPDGTRTSLARTLLFDRNPIPGAPKPVNDLGAVDERPLTRIRAQMIQEKVNLSESVVVYCWGDETPGSVWYAGYSLEDGVLVKNLETAMRQSVPGFLSVNLDRRVDASPLGYQLVFGVEAVPDAIIRKLATSQEAPLWGHVYARNAEGVYLQADERFGSHYRQLESRWNQLYLKAQLNNLPPEELAWFEYHMGIMNHYTGNSDMALALLLRAETGARDPLLQAAVKDGLALVTAESE